ncbi:hypothetical protein AYI69_g2898 [Smittium culicis]|uniref:Uncharacterized protein n=1 Tax=Smittium culicis TaxID=133412 RepID=A0A1R1YLB0_9FUNG|nr:hypothetical protein AYI69_g2898 [Smittium culicis]
MISSFKPKAKNTICIGGTPFKSGCTPNEFKADIDTIIEEILDKAIEFAEIVNYSDEYKFITLPSNDRLSLWEVAQKSYEILSNIGDVIDITSLKHTKFNSYPSNSIKFILKTKKDSENTNIINVHNIKVTLMWNEGKLKMYLL